MVISEDLERQTDLFQVVGAGDFLGFGFGLGQRGEEHAGQDRDNGDHDEQFNERKGSGLMQFDDSFHSVSRLG